MAGGLSGGTQSSRLQWYDRNPTQISNGYNSIDGPHTLTQRWTYVCPAGKKVLIESLHIRICRITAAGTPATVLAYVVYTPSGGSTYALLVVGFTASENTVGNKEAAQIGTALTLYPGDALSFLTIDGSTTGTVQHVGVYKGTVFDA
jgi:hypothetical protein